MITLPTEIVRSVLCDYSKIYEIITCKNLEDMIFGNVVGTGGAGIVITMTMTENIDKIGLEIGDQVAFKICRDSLGICKREKYDGDNDGGKKMRKEMRVLIANNDLWNFGICGNCNKSFGVISGCKRMDDKELLDIITGDKESQEIIMQEREDAIGGIATILEYISGVNLYKWNIETKINLLLSNKNIIFEMIYACMTTIICLGYLQGDLHSDNIMMKMHDKKNVTYDVYGNKISFNKKITPCMIDFGSVTFHSSRELKMSSVFDWCCKLFETSNETFSKIYPELFTDENREKIVEDMMPELPKYFAGDIVDKPDELYTFNESKIGEVSKTKELLMNNKKGGKKYNMVIIKK